MLIICFCACSDDLNIFVYTCAVVFILIYLAMLYTHLSFACVVILMM